MGQVLFTKNPKMPTVSTTHARDTRQSWFSVSTLPIGDKHIIEVKTSKDFSGELITNVRVNVVEGPSRFFRGGKDFLKCVDRTTGRITSAVVTNQHEKALSQIDAMLPEITAHYAKFEPLTH